MRRQRRAKTRPSNGSLNSDAVKGTARALDRIQNGGADFLAPPLSNLDPLFFFDPFVHLLRTSNPLEQDQGRNAHGE